MEAEAGYVITLHTLAVLERLGRATVEERWAMTAVALCLVALEAEVPALQDPAPRLHIAAVQAELARLVRFSLVKRTGQAAVGDQLNWSVPFPAAWPAPAVKAEALRVLDLWHTQLHLGAQAALT